MTLQQANDRPLRVLAVVPPGTESLPALHRIRLLSQHAKVQVKLFSALYDPFLTTWRAGGSTSEGDLKEVLIDHETQNLERIKLEYAALCESCDVEVVWRHPISAGVAEAAEDFQADLVLVASSSAARQLGYQEWEILKRVPTPVLVSKPETQDAYRRILVAVDPMHSHGKSEEMDVSLMQEAASFAALFGAQLHVVHAYPSERTFVTPEYLVPSEIIETWEAEHRSAVESLTTGFDVEEAHLVARHPREAIAETAKSIDADLVVLGVTSRSLVPDLIIGHTAEYVVNHVECDVLGITNK